MDKNPFISPLNENRFYFPGLIAKNPPIIPPLSVSKINDSDSNSSPEISPTREILPSASNILNSKRSKELEGEDQLKVHKRNRRTAQEIPRSFKCTVPGCTKAYGSEGALKMHIKNKHPKGAPTSIIPRRVPNPASYAPAPPVIIPSHLSKKYDQSQPRSDTGLNDLLLASHFLHQNTQPQYHLSSSISTPLMPRYTTSLNSLNLASVVSPYELFSVIYIPVISMRIGFIQLNSQFADEVTAKISFLEKTFSWEFNKSNNFTKIQFNFEDINSLRISNEQTNIVQLMVELKRPPLFYKSTDHLNGTKNWIPTSDFTNETALGFSQHVIEYNQSSLSTPLEQLLQADLSLTQALATLPSSTPYFPGLNLKNVK